ncbi:MAG: phosphoribosylglycinamide formyltransferase [Anaerolineae bacterium]|nr:phosphoribosylglycinamide formyltransferase [Anaerolineae bacterium]
MPDEKRDGKKIAVLVSGFGSNLQAILDAASKGQLTGTEVALVVSNRREAYGIQRAIDHGVPVVYFPLAPYTRAGRPRQEYDAALAAILRALAIEWVVMAGWMHVFGPAFLDHFPQRVVNLHPALPGAFPGTQAIARAYEAFQRGEIDGTGVMVHLVPDEGVDVGPVVRQEKVPIHPDDSLDDLKTRIHKVEHRLLVEALQQLGVARESFS